MTARILAALALVAALAAPASATVYTVCPSGCDTDCAGAAAKYLTMVTGDVLEIAAGVTCSGANLLSPPQSGLTVRGQDMTSTLDGGGSVATGLRGYTGAVFSTLTLTGYTSYAIGPYSSTKAMTVSDVRISGSAGGITGLASGSIVERAHISGTTGRGVNCPSAGVTVRNTLVVDAGATSIDCSQAAVEHCTAVGQTAGTYGIVADTARWNIISGCTTSAGGLRAITSETYNISYGNTPTNCYSACGTGTTNVDPLLVGGGDYHLTEASSAVDTATGSAYVSDLDGVVRDATPDRGAYEYVAPAATASPRWLVDGAQGLLLDEGAQGYLLYEGAK